MKQYVIHPAILIFGLFFLMPFIKIQAQHVSAYDSKGNPRSSANISAEEARNKAKKFPTTSTSASKPSGSSSTTPAETTLEESERLYNQAMRAKEALKKSLYGEYDFIGPEVDGLRPVLLEQKWGYMDKDRKIIIPIKYDEIGYNGEQKFGLKTAGMWGFSNRKGDIVIPFKYSSVINGFTDRGLAVVKEDNTEISINSMGRKLLPAEAFKINSGGYETKARFSEGLSAVSIAGNFGFVDVDNKIIAPLIYSEVGDFSDGLAKVRIGKKWGFIDKTGELIIAQKYDSAYGCVDGMAQVVQNRKYGYIGKTGEIIVPIVYDNKLEIYTQFIKVQENHKYGLLDLTGKILTPVKYDEYIRVFGDNFTVESNNKSGVLSKTGIELLEPKYDYITYCFDNNFMVSYNGKWGVISKTGSLLIEQKYDQMIAYEATFSVKLNDKWGLINTAGAEVVPIIYDEKCDESDFYIVKTSTAYAVEKYGYGIKDLIAHTPSRSENGLIFFKLKDQFVLYDYSGKKLKYKNVRTKASTWYDN